MPTGVSRGSFHVITYRANLFGSADAHRRKPWELSRYNLQRTRSAPQMPTGVSRGSFHVITYSELVQRTLVLSMCSK